VEVPLIGDDLELENNFQDVLSIHTRMIIVGGKSMDIEVVRIDRDFVTGWKSRLEFLNGSLKVV
jgi:hypothetical protein